MQKNKKSDKEALYTHYKIEFKDWGEDYDFTIVETLNDVLDYLQLADIYLDEPTRKTKVIITGIGMTRKAYSNWVKENLKLKKQTVGAKPFKYLSLLFFTSFVSSLRECFFVCEGYE